MVNIINWTKIKILFLTTLIEYGIQENIVATNTMLVDRLLPKDYDPLMPPKLDGKPVNVGVKISILNIRSIKETELSYIVDIFYHQYWSDYRILPQNLSLDQRIVLDNKWRHKLWIPDSYFKNALSGHVTDIIFPTLYFAVHNQTELFMASRVNSQKIFPCLNLTRIVSSPEDTEESLLSLFSKINKRPQFWLKEYSHNTCTKQYAIGIIILKRQLGLYIVKKYIPSCLIVVMSFVGFWIPVTAYPARVALVITALLALITQQHQSTEVNVSYVIALNVWMIICIAFVFFALIEYAIAIAYFESKLEAKESQQGKNNIEVLQNNSDHKESDLRLTKAKWIQNLIHSSNGQIRFNTYDPDFQLPTKNYIDTVSRYLFPISYIVCIILYLIYLYA